MFLFSIFCLSLITLLLITSHHQLISSLIKAIVNGYNVQPFSCNGENTKIGIFGDSTGVGVGSSCPQMSLAGMLSRHYPNSTILNYCATGNTIKKTIKVLRRYREFDLMILCCIGIDLLCFKKTKDIKKDIKKMFLLASRRAKNILYITPVNLGLSPIFPWYYKKYFFKKCFNLGLFIEKESKKYKNIIVQNNLLVKNASMVPDFNKISSYDKIHPNDLGYLWAYKKVLTKLPTLACSK